MRLILGKVLVLMVMACCLQAAIVAPFKEGVHYTKLQSHEPPLYAHTIEVLAFFWYGCPHCYEVEMNPMFSAWRSKLPKDVIFRGVPVTLGRKEGEVHAQLYYTIEALFPDPKQAELVHHSVFQAIHANSKARFLIEESDLTNFFNGEWKIQPNVFKQKWSASAFSAKIMPVVLAKRYQISGVPTFTVGGRYMTSPSQINPNGVDFPTLVRVLDFLIEQARKQKL